MRVRILLGIDEAHVEHVGHVHRNDFQVRLSKGLPEADAPSAIEWDEGECTSLFTVRRQ